MLRWTTDAAVPEVAAHAFADLCAACDDADRRAQWTARTRPKDMPPPLFWNWCALCRATTRYAYVPG